MHLRDCSSAPTSTAAVVVTSALFFASPCHKSDVFSEGLDPACMFVCPASKLFGAPFSCLCAFLHSNLIRVV